MKQEHGTNIILCNIIFCQAGLSWFYFGHLEEYFLATMRLGTQNQSYLKDQKIRPKPYQLLLEPFRPSPISTLMI